MDWLDTLLKQCSVIGQVPVPFITAVAAVSIGEYAVICWYQRRVVVSLKAENAALEKAHKLDVGTLEQRIKGKDEDIARLSVILEEKTRKLLEEINKAPKHEKVWNLGVNQLVKEAPELRRLEKHHFININPITPSQTSVSSTSATIALLNDIQSGPEAVMKWLAARQSSTGKST